MITGSMFSVSGTFILVRLVRQYFSPIKVQEIYLYVHVYQIIILLCDVTVAGHSTDCYQFEVGGADSYTSVHLPLHRMLAGLNNHLPDDVNHLSPDFSPTNRQYGLLCLIEQPLCLQVLLAQVQADMWKRNGFSILNQVGVTSMNLSMFMISILIVIFVAQQRLLKHAPASPRAWVGIF